MTHRFVGLGFGLLFVFVQAGCTDNTAPLYTQGPGGGSGGQIDELCADEGGPLVVLVAPVASSDPNADPVEIVTEPTVVVQCTVASSGEPVDDSSVLIEVFGEDGENITPTVSNEGNGTFEAKADVSGLPNGALRVTCAAANAEPSEACTGTAADTFLDLGPGIDMIEPAETGTVHSGGMTVRFTVFPLPVSDSDTLSAGSAVRVVVAGQDITATPESSSGGATTFAAPVDFDDPALYATPLDGTYQLSVSATNQRGVTRSVVYDFTVDAEGPGIQINEPRLGDVIGAATSVVATISDVSGIDPTRVSFYIGSEQFPMTAIPGSTNRFEGSFDANQYSTSIGEVSINVVAVDTLGNEHVASVTVELDGVPPVLDMDPPLVREGRRVTGGIECSEQFDPVGPFAISDQDVVTPVSYIRVRVEDRGNPSASYKSGLDKDSVQAWILRGTGVPLVIDTDGDGTCDSINPDVLPGNVAGNTAAVELDLISVAPSGSPNYTPQTFGSGYGYCLSGMQMGNNDNVCRSVGISRVIPDNREPSGAVPAIYVKAPVIPAYCLGDPFDWQTSLDLIEGPGCMAVSASDERGNSSVSQPLQVCFTNGGPGCAGFSPGSYTCAQDCSGATFPTNELIGPFN